jgi:hypothetical protein
MIPALLNLTFQKSVRAELTPAAASSKNVLSSSLEDCDRGSNPTLCIMSSFFVLCYPTLQRSGLASIHRIPIEYLKGFIVCEIIN